MKIFRSMSIYVRIFGMIVLIIPRVTESIPDLMAPTAMISNLPPIVFTAVNSIAQSWNNQNFGAKFFSK